MLNIFISDRIKDKVEPSQLERVLVKLNTFAQEIVQNNASITAISKGFWTRPVRGCPGRYKFRINNKNRVVFEYGRSKEEIYFLDYCNHDEQIRAAKNIAKITPEELVIDYTAYEEEKIDAYIDENYTSRAYSFADARDWVHAADLFRQSGDKQNKKCVEFLKRCYNQLQDFENYGYGRHFITLLPGKESLNEKSLLYLLNRIRSTYSLKLGKEFRLKHCGTEISRTLDVDYKDINKHNQAMAKLMSELFQGALDEVYINCCFYYAGEPVQESMYLVMDYGTNQLTRVDYPPYVDLFRQVTQDDSNGRQIKDYMHTAKNKLTDSQKLAKTAMLDIFGEDIF